MQSEEAKSSGLRHPITMWAANPRLQTFFSPEEGFGGGDVPVATETVEATAPTIERSESDYVSDSDDIDATESTQRTTEADDTTDDLETGLDPDEVEYRKWKADYDAAPPSVQRTLMHHYKEAQAAREELQRLRAQSQPQPTQPAQPQPDLSAVAQNYEREVHNQYDVIEKQNDIIVKTQAKLAIATAGGSIEEAQQHIDTIKQAQKNIRNAEGQITKLSDAFSQLRTEQETAQRARVEQWWNDCGPRVATEIRRDRALSEGVREAADEFSEVHRTLAYFLGEQKANKLLSAALLKASAKSGAAARAPKVTDIERQRAKARARSETPDGGVTTGTKTAEVERDMDAWVDRVLGINKQRR